MHGTVRYGRGVRRPGAKRDLLPFTNSLRVFLGSPYVARDVDSTSIFYCTNTLGRGLPGKHGLIAEDPVAEHRAPLAGRPPPRSRCLSGRIELAE